MLILASASPRRKMLLESAGLKPVIQIADIDESHVPLETPKDYVMRMAQQKAAAIPVPHDDEPRYIIAADTIVVADNQILGKPMDATQAHAMLSNLSGRSHSVMTGVCIVAAHTHQIRHFVTETRVFFAHLSEKTIQRYIQTGEPMDKAGAYGIQSGAAGFVERIEGSYTNVVGLPLCETLQALSELGFE